MIGQLGGGNVKENTKNSKKTLAKVFFRTSHLRMQRSAFSRGDERYENKEITGIFVCMIV